MTNFIPPYRVPVFQALARQASELEIYISTSMEANRSWPIEWGTLNVHVQHTLTLNQQWRHPYGFTEPVYIHIPYDTLSVLLHSRPDVVISGELGLRTLQALIYRKLHPNSRLIVWATLSEHLEQGRGRLRTMLRKLILPQVDGVLVNGASGQRYIQRFGVPAGKVTRVPQTTDISPFLDIPLEKGEASGSRLLYVGRLVELKGLKKFLQVLGEWGRCHPDRQVEFLIAGDGPERPKLEKVQMPGNIAVHFLGDVDYQDIPQVYAQGGILVLPTLADEWGLVINEALAAGLPVLGSLYSQAVEELIREGETGWVFRPDQGEEMCEALARVLATPAGEIAVMRQKSRETIKTLTADAVGQLIGQAALNVFLT